MYSKTSAANRTSRNSVMAGGAGAASGVLQDDLDDDIAGVAAAVHGLLDHLVELLEDDELLGVVGAVIKVLEEAEHDLVGLALGELKAVVGLADFFDVRAAAELLHHEHDGLGGLQHELGLALKRGVRHAAGVDGQALDNFFDLLRDAVKRERKRLDILALERRDEGLAQLLGHRVADALFLAPGLDELVE